MNAFWDTIFVFIFHSKKCWDVVRFSLVICLNRRISMNDNWSDCFHIINFWESFINLTLFCALGITVWQISIWLVSFTLLTIQDALLEGLCPFPLPQARAASPIRTTSGNLLSNMYSTPSGNLSFPRSGKWVMWQRNRKHHAGLDRSTIDFEFCRSTNFTI